MTDVEGDEKNRIVTVVDVEAFSAETCDQPNGEIQLSFSSAESDYTVSVIVNAELFMAMIARALLNRS